MQRYVRQMDGQFGWIFRDLTVMGRWRDLEVDGLRLASFDVVGRDVATDRTVSLGRLILGLDPSRDPPLVRDIVSLNVLPSRRGQGHGSRIVDTILAIADGPVRVCDIAPEARAFWERRGCEGYVETGRRLDAWLSNEERAPALV